MTWNKIHNPSGFLFNDKYSYSFIYLLPIFPWIGAFSYKFLGKTQLWSLFNRPGEYCPLWGLGECQREIPFQIHLSRQNTDLKQRLERRTILKVGSRSFGTKSILMWRLRRVLGIFRRRICRRQTGTSCLFGFISLFAIPSACQLWISSGLTGKMGCK